MSTPPPSSDDDDPPIAPDAKEMGIDEAMQLAVRLHQEDRLDGACTLYRRILQAVPGHVDAMGMLGVAEHQMGRSEEGLRLIHAAIDRAPDFAGFHVNLGNVLVELHRLEEALVAYARASALMPGSADVLNNIGAVHRALGQFDEALRCYERAIELDPRHVRAWNNLGLLYDAQARTEDAVRCFLTALDLLPGNAHAAFLLGATYYRVGRIEKAAEVFRQWMAREPDNPVPAHLYAACSGEGVPERASDAYVEAEFDKFAGSFERVLNERLDYRAPQLAAGLLGEMLPAPDRSLQVLDVGCGTGLCGPLVAPWAQRLVGVDLSGGMLMRARVKGVYDELVKAELTAFLAQGAQRWDAVVCADTLCYFGDLGTVMQAAATALKPGATMVFTVEALPDDAADRADIQPSGRYAHGRAHLDRVVAAAGLVTCAARREALRKEGGVPVQGWLLAVQRPLPPDNRTLEEPR